MPIYILLHNLRRTLFIMASHRLRNTGVRLYEKPYLQSTEDKTYGLPSLRLRAWDCKTVVFSEVQLAVLEWVQTLSPLVLQSLSCLHVGPHKLPATLVLVVALIYIPLPGTFVGQTPKDYLLCKLVSELQAALHHQSYSCFWLKLV
jgi:hypothetical protein